MKAAEWFLQQGIHPALAPWFGHLYEVAASNGLRPQVTSTYRSPEKQAALYKRWLEGKNAYPVARPGTSYHEYGRAVDMVVTNAPQLGAYWRYLGGTWGGEKDPVHFHA